MQEAHNGVERLLLQLGRSQGGRPERGVQEANQRVGHHRRVEGAQAPKCAQVADQVLQEVLRGQEDQMRLRTEEIESS